MHENKAKALALNSAGIALVMARDWEDTYEKDGKTITRYPKSPIGADWQKHPIVTETAVNGNWYDSRTKMPLPAAHTGASGLFVVDLDPSDGANPYEPFLKAGIAIPEGAIQYTTRSGGAHIIFRAPQVVLSNDGGWTDTKLRDGNDFGTENVKVDIRQGNSIAVWWGPAPTKEQVDALPLPPSSLYDFYLEKNDAKRKQTGVGYTGPIEKWENKVDNSTGEMDDFFLKQLDRLDEVPAGNISYSLGLSVSYRLVEGHAKGLKGFPYARDLFITKYLDGFDTEDMRNRVIAWFTSAIRKVGEVAPMTTEEVNNSLIEEMGEKKYLEKKAQLYAERKLQGELAIGTKRYSWDELEDMQVHWIVDGFLPFNSKALLVAEGNLGKTFTFIDWMCSSIMGFDWKGHATKPAKFMVVIGEGPSGFMGRIKAWCEENGGDLDLIKANVIPMSKASLASDSDIDKMMQEAQREGIDCLILDTWNATSGLKDENDNATTGLALLALDRINDGMSVLIVHHPDLESAKGASPKPRGASALYGAVDVCATMFKKAHEVDGTDKKYITISTEPENGGKVRDGGRSKVTDLYLKDVTIERKPDGTTVTSKVLALASGVLSGKEKRLKNALASGPKTMAELTVALEKGEKTIRGYIADVEQVKERPTGNGRELEYFWEEPTITWNGVAV